jgi:8-oxo-dGTP diphosphatase
MPDPNPIVDQLIEGNHMLGMSLSEIGRAAGLPPGASSCEIQTRVTAMAQEIAELRQEHGVLLGRLHARGKGVSGVDYPGVSVRFFCHDGHGRLLMGKRTANCRDEHGMWDCGSGAVDLGFGVEETLLKELAEEYCVVPLRYGFLGYHGANRVYRSMSTHWVMLDFAVLVDPADVVNREPHKCSDLDFFPFDSLPTPQHSQFPAAWERYRARIAEASDER